METVEDVDRLELPDPARVRYLTQTTLSLDETRDIIERLKQRFPLIQGPPAQDICYATRKPPDGGEGDRPRWWTCCWWSARRTARIPSGWWRWATNFGVRSYLVNDRGDVDRAWLDGGEERRSDGGSLGARAPGARS